MLHRITPVLPGLASQPLCSCHIKVLRAQEELLPPCSHGSHLAMAFVAWVPVRAMPARGQGGGTLTSPASETTWSRFPYLTATLPAPAEPLHTPCSLQPSTCCFSVWPRFTTQTAGGLEISAVALCPLYSTSSSGLKLPD